MRFITVQMTKMFGRRHVFYEHLKREYVSLKCWHRM